MRGIILANSEVILEVIEQLGSPNSNIRKQAEQLVEVVQYYSPQWANTIKLKKYKVHNQIYIQAMDEYARMAANAQFVDQEMDDANPNGIQWYDTNDMGGRIWTQDPEQDDF